jgi:hypothetical protein
MFDHTAPYQSLTSQSLTVRVSSSGAAPTAVSGMKSERKPLTVATTAARLCHSVGFRSPDGAAVTRLKTVRPVWWALSTRWMSSLRASCCRVHHSATLRSRCSPCSPAAVGAGTAPPSGPWWHHPQPRFWTPPRTCPSRWLTHRPCGSTCWRVSAGCLLPWGSSSSLDAGSFVCAFLCVAPCSSSPPFSLQAAALFVSRFALICADEWRTTNRRCAGA